MWGDLRKLSGRTCKAGQPEAMKILAWNCQGCGNPKTARALKKLLAKHQPDVVFLMETKQISSNSCFLSNYANDFCIKTIDCSTTGGGKAGGLALMWKNCNFDLNIIDHDLNYIDCMISSHNMHWRATGIYGFSVHNQKILTCNIISDLAKTNTNPNWLVFGDFNMVLSSNEKVGGNPIDYNITTAFRECLEQSNLEDLGYNGDLFTWHNRQQDNQYIQARLDRFCASNDWIYNFSHYQNSHLLRYGSDHCPILLEFSTLTPPNLNHNRPIGKRFEQIWTEDEEHTRIVREAWDNHNQELQNKLEDTLSSLHY
jgi:exonuclease III